jgi:hypothetical protein
VHQVGHYPESHQDVRSTEHKTQDIFRQQSPSLNIICTVNKLTKILQNIGLRQRFETCRPASRIQRRCDCFNSIQDGDRDSSERLVLSALPLLCPTVSSTIKQKKKSSHGGYYDIAVVWTVKSTIYPDDGGNKILGNIDKFQPDYMASYPEDGIYQ